MPDAMEPVKKYAVHVDCNTATVLILAVQKMTTTLC